MNSQQTAIDTITAELGQVKASLASTQTDVQVLSAGVTTLETQATTLQQQIADLLAQQAAGTPVDLTALTAAAGDLVTSAGVLRIAADSAAAKLPA